MPTQLMVTAPFLPPLDEFVPYLEEIWKRQWLTNNGPLHQQFEQELATYLGVPFVSLFNNGETALIVALKALDVSGEVITTPFSFVGTATAILWAGLEPVFADVDAASFNLDPAAVQRKITSRTAAILPVHCFGHPVDTAGMAAIAAETNIAIVYDAAHAFDVKYRGQSLLLPGELSILSFHATKVFSTFEGGAIVSHTPEMKRRIDLLKNFGIADELTVELSGLNGKMSEFQAALGLVQLRYVSQAREARRRVADAYRQLLTAVPGISLPVATPHTEPNFGYFPILVEGDGPAARDALYEALKRQDIFGRRYFYPLISDTTPFRSNPSAQGPLPVARRVADRILCLPISASMHEQDAERVALGIAQHQRTHAPELAANLQPEPPLHGR
ncbi:MAG: DegT/DnrJ/EryC1/StrS family aminotransferase [Devosia sp.]|nr:DegT/DnrJ/EryC1/StrS family aminotransferase [Devosia sp.]